MGDGRTERLREYLKLITRKQGGLEGVITRRREAPEAPAAELMASGATGADPRAALEGLERLALGQDISDEQRIGVEAIIDAELRPAFKVIDGTFEADHPLWMHLTRDAVVRKRIESVIPLIGRIELPGNAQYPYGGTGFVVGEGLIMTNRHVAEIFAAGLGDRNLRFITGLEAGIDFLQEDGRPTGPNYRVRRVAMIHPYWDMALLEVEGLPPDRRPLNLALADARDLNGHDIFVVGYPAFDPRNPADVQQDLFDGRYGIKRLQPGELQGGRRTGSFGKLVPAATHDCSTLGGNSGSAVLDLETGEVLGLHFGGLYHDANYAVPSCELGRDRRVVDAGVAFAGMPSGGPNDWADWWSRADAGEAPADDAISAPVRGDTSRVARATTVSTSGRGPAGAVDIEIPLRITISLGGAASSLDVGARADAGGADTDLVEAMREPQRDPNYANRRGYDANFLSAAGAAAIAVPMPDAADPAALARTQNGADVLHYQNFSIKMHAARRLALITASNITKEAQLRKPEAGKDYSRKGLGGLGDGDVERWFLDPRLDAKYQIPDAFFTKDDTAFDKGHVVRREDVAWGSSYAVLRRANGDSFHVTNCTPQVAGFNRSNLGEDNWGDLENHVLSEAASERLCVFAGPVLDPSDEVFVGVGEGGVTLRAKIPSRYWKVIVARTADGLAAYGFVLEQDLSDVRLEFSVPAAFVSAMYTIADIEAMTGVAFAPAIGAADQYGTVRGTEVALRSGARRKKAGRKKRSRSAA